MHILFLCTGNSCRSILAEGIFNKHAPQGFTSESAGSKPSGYIHPLALAELSQHNINVQGFASKSWNELISKPDLVITLCSEAAGEACPLYLGDVLRAHWHARPCCKPRQRSRNSTSVFSNLQNARS